MSLRPSSILVVPLAALLVTATTSARAVAQPTAPTAQPPAQTGTLIGVGVWSRPVYVGSDERVLSPIPILRYYGGPWFARTTQGMLEAGARLALSNGLSIGTQIAYEIGRDSEASDFLESRDVETLPVSVSLGVHAGWDTNFGPAPVNVLLRYRQEVGPERGAQADLRATIGIYGGANLRLGLFGQTTWANAKSNLAYYGVSPAQSTATGLPVFASSAGVVYGAAGLLWGYEVNAKWLLQGSVEARQLSANLRSSPLTQVRNNRYVSAGLAYRR